MILMRKSILFIILAFAFIQTNLFSQPSGIINRKDTAIFHQFGQTVFPFSYNGKMGLIDNNNKIVLPAIYSRIGYIYDNYRSYSIDGKEGFLKVNGDILIEAIYDKVGYFSDGIAYVKANRKVTFIDTSGKMICQWFDETYSFQNNFASVRLGNKWGAISKSGKVIVEIKYQHVAAFSKYGLTRIKLNNKYGYVNSNGAVTIPINFSDASHFFDDLCAVKRGGKWGFIDTNGNMIIPFQYRKANSFSKGALYTSVKVGLFKWERINRKGEIVK